MSATLFFDRLLCAIGLRTLNQQFLFSYALMFLLALVASRHLTLLARAGVLEARKEGRTMSYQVRFERLCDSLRALADAIEDCCPDGSCCEAEC
jgi:hypothetical protein